MFFSFSYPFSYSENQQFLRELEDKFMDDDEIYLNKEVLIYSPQGRSIDLITITSKEGMLNI